MTTAVLVHGGWHSASCWDLVRAELTADGIRSVAPQLPMTSTLDVDAAVVRETLDSLDDDAVVVAHSWGGSPVTLGASGAPNVRHLIYLAAFMIEAGKPAPVDFRTLPPMPAFDLGPEVCVVVPEYAYDAFYHDVDPQVAAECTAQLRPFARVGWDLVETSVPPAWSLYPTTYVVTAQDHGVNPDDQRAMAAKANNVVELDTSHSPFLSQPRKVADIIAERVRLYSALTTGFNERVMTTQQTYAETAIGPDIPIVEAHHHMWPSDRYNRADLERDISQGHRVIKTVFIDCSASYRTDGPDHLKPVGETEWAVTQQGPDGICAGIVGHVNMYLGSQAGEVLDAHLEAGGSSFKGIRHNVAWDRHPDTNNALRGAPEFALLDPVFQAATAEVAKRGLIFETWLYFNQLSDIKKLARAQPDLRIVLNHLGGPACNGPYAADRPGMLGEWRRNMADLAEAPNVYLKVGGIGYKSFVEQSVLDGPRSSEFLAEYWKPEICFAIEAFGPERSMFETNYPEDRHLTNFVVLWNTYKRIADSFSADERSWVFEKAARSVYGI